MKARRILAYLLCFTSAISLTACGAKERTSADENFSYTNKEETAMESYDAEEFPAADESSVYESPAADSESHDETFKPHSYQQNEKVGVLTAGEWNDNENWEFFSNLVSKGYIDIPDYSIDITNRIAVQVFETNTEEPFANAKVSLVDNDGDFVWSSVSGEDGMAYLFYPDIDIDDLDCVIVSADGETSVHLVKDIIDEQDNPQKSEIADLQVYAETSCQLYDDMQVMFILDTTGSMGDEMMFLQSEFASIAQSVGSDDIEYSVNFYRDHGDKYVTKCNDFTYDTNEITRLLNKESAKGGGDHPEAVAEILTETLVEAQWNEDAVKVAFLIFDAPPHDDKKQELEAAISAASEKGIRLVPVVSSNSDRNTEIFARTAAIATNGTYVFLTDDSGVGNSHLEPIIGEHDVELLRDIIIRIINDFKQGEQ